MILDLNAYIGRWPYWPVGQSEPDEVLAALARWGIDRAAVCSTRSIFVHFEDGNRETEAAAANDDRLIPFACLGPLEASHALAARQHDLEDYAARGFRGVRLYPQHHSYHPLYEPFLDAVLEDAASRRWPVVLPLRLIMNWGLPVLELPVIDALVTRHPRAVWVLAGINYLHELQVAVSLMRRFDGVNLELSCVMGFNAVEKLVQTCGAERLLFGSGSPLQNGAAAVSKVARAKISEAAREAIFSGNALRLLNEADNG